MSKKQQNQLQNLRGGFKKKKIDTEEIEETIKDVYAPSEPATPAPAPKPKTTEPKTMKQRKTSIDLPDKIFKQLKYISMMEETSMKELIMQGIEQVLKDYKSMLPSNLK